MGRRRLLLGGFSLLAAPRIAAGVSDPSPLIQANHWPVEDIGGYYRQFQDFREEAATGSDRGPTGRVEETALHATGKVRLAEGVSFLRDDAALRWIARHYAAQMAAGAVFGHVDGGGRHPADRIALLHRRMVGVNGENLYVSSAFDADRAEAAGRLAVDNLMQSPGHRANMLDPRWTHAGIGAAVGPEGLLLVQLFAERAALLLEPMPPTCRAGAPLPAGCWQAAEGTFDAVALTPAGREPTAADFARPGALAAPSGLGLHRSFFARANDRTRATARFTIHPGPMLRVV